MAFQTPSSLREARGLARRVTRVIAGSLDACKFSLEPIRGTPGKI
jgi:hypothetical protein